MCTCLSTLLYIMTLTPVPEKSRERSMTTTAETTRTDLFRQDTGAKNTKHPWEVSVNSNILRIYPIILLVSTLNWTLSSKKNYPDFYNKNSIFSESENIKWKLWPPYNRKRDMVENLCKGKCVCLVFYKWGRCQSCQKCIIHWF